MTNQPGRQRAAGFAESTIGRPTTCQPGSGGADQSTSEFKDWFTATLPDRVGQPRRAVTGSRATELTTELARA